MKCHYEVLSVARDAEDADIKKSYRKLALLYHPDKNPDKIEEVTELFREVQSAYDVLSDPQERAWYDKHREAILRGGEDFVDDSLDVMYYFNPRIFVGFDDGLKSFYTVFRDAFCKLAKEDEPYAEDDSEEIEIPEFGYSYSDYESVVKPFYIYWLAYRTKKSFVWKEKYDIRQAVNRPTQRLMEKENKKLRDSSRKKRNEEVRALVSYVRKRDKRVQEELQKIKSKQEEQQRKAKEKRELEKINRNKMLDDYEEQEWMTIDNSKLDEVDSHFDNLFGSVVKDNSDDSDCENDQHYYCIACDKYFKSEKALENHEKSKKHKENVELIKNELEEDFLLELIIESPKKEVLPKTTNKESSSRLVDEDAESSLARLSSIHLPVNVVKRNVIDKVEVKGVNTNLPKQQKGKQKKGKDILIHIEEGESESVINQPSGDGIIHTSSNSKSPMEDTGFQNVEEHEKDISLEKNINQENSHNNTTDEGLVSKEYVENSNGENEVSTKKDKKNKKNENKGESSGEFKCEICTKGFPTRNKLFKHITVEGHAKLKEDTKNGKKNKGKKK